MISNDNLEVMALLPTPISNFIFKLGFRAGSDLLAQTRSAQYSPSCSEALDWISTARTDARVRAVDYMNQFAAFAHDEDLRWAARRIADEGFESFFREASNERSP